MLNHISNVFPIELLDKRFPIGTLHLDTASGEFWTLIEVKIFTTAFEETWRKLDDN